MWALPGAFDLPPVFTGVEHLILFPSANPRYVIEVASLFESIKTLYLVTAAEVHGGIHILAEAIITSFHPQSWQSVRNDISLDIFAAQADRMKGP